MKAIALLLLVLGGPGCRTANEVTGPTASPVPINGRVIEFLSRDTIRSAPMEFRSLAGSPAIATATDGAGRYSATLPRGGEYQIFVNGIARGIAYVGGSFLGDLIIHDGRCIARYGTVTDATGRPLAKASVSLGALSTGSALDGWYSIEFGCPQAGIIGSNTVLMNASLDGYASAARIIGPGLSGVERLDIVLNKPRD